MASYTDKLTDAEAMGIISQVEGVFKGLPHLPSGIVDFLVKIAPYMALISGILALLAGPVIGLLGGLGSILSLSPILMISTLGSAIVMIISAILMLMAFGPLKNRQMKGWIFLFWSEALSIVNLIFTLMLGETSGLVGGVIGILIGFYVLFEMKSRYTAAGQVVAAAKSAAKKMGEVVEGEKVE